MSGQTRGESIESIEGGKVDVGMAKRAILKLLDLRFERRMFTLGASVEIVAAARLIERQVLHDGFTRGNAELEALVTIGAGVFPRIDIVGFTAKTGQSSGGMIIGIRR